MKTLKILICLSAVFLFCSNSIAQTHDFTMNPQWDFYSLNYQSVENAGKGYTGAASEGDLMSVLLNPASIRLEKKYQAYLEYDVKSTLPWNIVASDNYRMKQIQPVFAAGLGFRLSDDFQSGVIIRSERNWMFDLGRSYLYIGSEYFDSYETYTTNSLTVPVAYHYKGFDFGVNLNVMLMHSRVSYLYYGLSETSVDVSTNNLRFIPDLGIRVTPMKELSFGLTFTPGFEQEIERQYPSQPTPYRTTAYYPWKLGAGAEVRLLNERLKLSGEYRYEHTSVYDGTGSIMNYKFKDRNNIRLGAEYKPDDKFTLQCGFFTLLDMRPSGNPELPDNEFSQFNLTAGFGYRFKDVKINIACVNGLSKKAEVMRVSFGAVYNF